MADRLPGYRVPNFVTNNIRITGPAADIEELKEFMVTDVTDFDFAQAIPIPELRDRSLDPYIALVFEEDKKLRRQATRLASDAGQVREGFTDMGITPQEVIEIRGHQSEEGFWQEAGDFAVVLNQKAEKRRQSGAQPGERWEMDDGYAALRDLERQGIIAPANQGDGAAVAWGARGPLGEPPIDTLVSHTKKSGQGKLRYRLTTAWDAPLLAYRALSERFSSVEITIAFNDEGSMDNRIGIYRFTAGEQVCEFDAPCMQDGFVDAVERVDGKQLLQHLGVPTAARKKR